MSEYMGYRGPTRRERKEWEDAKKEIALATRDKRELSIEDIRGQIRGDALQHPLTVYPITLGILSVFYLIFVSPFLGGALIATVALGAAVGGAALGIICFGCKWLIFGKNLLKKKTAELATIQQRYKEEDFRYAVEERWERLQQGFQSINSSDGLKELAELRKEHSELRECLANHPGSDIISIQQLAKLADDTYMQGLGVLETALEIMRGVDSADIRALETDIEQVQKEIERLRRISPQDEIIAIKADTLESHRKRLATMKGQQIYVARLLAQSDKCEAVLAQTRSDLNILSIEQAAGQGQQVVERLQRVIEMAKSVQEELKKMEGVSV